MKKMFWKLRRILKIGVYVYGIHMCYQILELRVLTVDRMFEKLQIMLVAFLILEIPLLFRRERLDE